ncbi:MAG: long-chain-fatty-acid--CoA ligase [Gammaproteobacteria bacterium]|nr:MAG: long-chain-fatty-acid--CoA ligase [Gammaproteobacteria bacterium]
MSDESRFWLKYYPEGIPADIDAGRYQSLVEFFADRANEYSGKPAYDHVGTQISYKNLDQLTQRFSSYLQQECELKKGDRVALMMPNILAYPVAMFGALRAGAIIVNINPLYTARELQQQLEDSGATVIVVLENFAHALKSVIDDTSVRHVITTRVGDLHSFPKSWLINTYTRYISKLKPVEDLRHTNLSHCIHCRKELSTDVEIAPEDIAFLQYTGGTTGISKGAMLTHRNMVANTLQACAWLDSALNIEKLNIISALPLYHIFALTAHCLIVMNLGGCNHLITNPRDIKGFIKTLKKIQFHAITGVNTLFNALLNQPEFRWVDFSSLKLTLAGGMAVQRKTASDWQKITGNPIVEAYGLTETSPAACANPPGISEYTGTIGFPVPSTEVSIRDDDDDELPLGQEGELWIRGPQVMKGYWNKPEETRQVLTDDGWLKTGDMAIMSNHGTVRIVDRKKDMIIISGFNVYPNEIEDVLTHHPAIVEAGVIGVSHEQTGEAVKAVIVTNNKQLTEEDVIAYCREQLTAYKVPKIIEFRDDLPKTNVGKVLRRELR